MAGDTLDWGSMNNGRDFSPETTVLNLLAGRWVSQAISAAAVLGISDILQDQPMSLAELAHATNCNSHRLKRLMTILVGEGIYAYDPTAERYATTPLSDTLSSTGNIKHLAEFLGSPSQSSSWTALVPCVRSLSSAFEIQHGKRLYEWLDEHPSESDLYDQAIDRFTLRISKSLASTYDFSSAKHIMDVGGGLGTTLEILLAKWPHLSGTLIDREPVIKQATSKFHQRGLGERCTFKANDFFEPLPQGSDICILKHILHNWDDKASVALLKNCRAAIAPHGQLLVIEGILPPGENRSFAHLMDLQMMVLFGSGSARSKQEFRALFQQSGWKLLRTTYPLDSFSRLLIAHPA